jgi:hypothetical protein
MKGLDYVGPVLIWHGMTEYLKQLSRKCQKALYFYGLSLWPLKLRHGVEFNVICIYLPFVQCSCKCQMFPTTDKAIHITSGS